MQERWIAVRRRSSVAMGSNQRLSVTRRNANLLARVGFEESDATTQWQAGQLDGKQVGITAAAWPGPSSPVARRLWSVISPRGGNHGGPLGLMTD